MMDAVEFLKERKRMCDSLNNCSKCRLHERFGKCSLAKIDFDKMEDTVSIVEQWSKEHQHPVKTNRDVLIDLVEEHFGSNCGWSSNGFDDSISLYFTKGFLDEAYKGRSLEQTEDKLSFKEIRDLFGEMCNSKKTCSECILSEKTFKGGPIMCKRWCFDHPQEVQEILLKWKKEGESK